MPTDKLDSVNLADPLVSALELTWVPSTDKVTVPVGIQEYCGATVTVKLTVC
jgi:hypothetical protein